MVAKRETPETRPMVVEGMVANKANWRCCFLRERYLDQGIRVIKLEGGLGTKGEGKWEGFSSDDAKNVSEMNDMAIEYRSAG